MTRPERPGAWRRFRMMSRSAQLLTWVGLLALLLVAPSLAGSLSAVNSGGAPPTASTGPQPVSSSPASTGAPTALPSSTTPTTRATTTTALAESTASSCHLRGSGSAVLPDPACTPGAVNPGVTQADIASTICQSGWTATVRPPESYTYDLKVQQMAAYGEAGPTSAYEEDHLIPLELGGSPASPLNLWPEPGGSPNQKDEVENAAKYAVCDGEITLAYAQNAIATDWVTFAQELGVPVATGPVETSAAANTSPATSTLVAEYKAGQFCPQAKIGQTVNTPGGPLTCEVLSDPSHPHWMHS